MKLSIRLMVLCLSLAIAFGQDPSYVLMDRFIPQFVDGGGWKTSVTFFNTGASATNCSLFVFDSSGNAWNLPISTGNPFGVEKNSNFTVRVPAFGSVTYETTDTTGNTQQGYAVARVNSSPTIHVFYTFRQRVGGRESEGTDLASTSGAAKLSIPFNNRAGFATGFALVNTSTRIADYVVTVYDQSGTRISTSLVTFNPREHQAFNLAQKFPDTSGREGMVEIKRVDAKYMDYSMAVVGIRFNPAGTFSAMPAR